MTDPENTHPYLRRQLKRLLDENARLESRVTTLEAVIFRLEPSESGEKFDDIEAVKNFLTTTNLEAMPSHVAKFLAGRLTVDWRDLVKKHGHVRVFDMLRNNHNILEARRALA